MRRRGILITAFVIFWSCLFHYESLRQHYLGPLLGRTLPKVALLFPPAGWIMFFRVSPSYGFAEVYGRRGQALTKLDPHDIFRTRAVGYDNIRRNVMVGVLYQNRASAFCSYLRWKFPAYESFVIYHGEYPDLIRAPADTRHVPIYQCAPAPRS